MSTIESRLRASVAMDAINGDAFERSVCARQMIEAAREIDRLRSELQQARAENAALRERLRLNGIQEPTMEE